MHGDVTRAECTVCVCDSTTPRRLGHVQVRRGNVSVLFEVKQLEKIFQPRLPARLAARLVPPEVTGPFGQLLTLVRVHGPGSITILVFVNPVIVSPKPGTHSAPSPSTWCVSCWTVPDFHFHDYGHLSRELQTFAVSLPAA